MKPKTESEKNKTIIIACCIAVLISVIINYGMQVQSSVWFMIWWIAPIGIALIYGFGSSLFSGKCSFVGNMGFAIFHFDKIDTNVTSKLEVNFKDVIHLYTSAIRVKENFSYKHTEYFFLWMKDDEVVYKIESTHSNKNNTPGSFPFEYYFMDAAQKQWLSYLL